MRRTRTPKSPWILLVLALAMIGAVAGVWNRSTTLTAQDLLDSATRRYDDERDLPAALREVNLAIAQAEEASENEVLAGALELRSRLYRDRDSYDLALADLQRVATDLRPDDEQLTLDMIEIEVRAEQYEEAAARCLAFMEKRPYHAVAWSQLARVHRFQGDQILDAANEDFQEMFSDSLAFQARALSRRTAAMEPKSVARAAVLADLQELYEENGQENFEDLESAIGRATELYAAARGEFATAIAQYVGERMLVGLTELFALSGRNDYVVDFGAAALNQEQTRSSPVVMRILADAFEREGRLIVAAAVIDMHRRAGRDLNDSFMEDFVHILYEAESWTRLLQVAQEMKFRAEPGNPGAYERRTAQFYVGMAQLRLGQNVKALDSLSDFLVNTAKPPFPEAEALALYGLAEASRAQGILDEERRYLRSALNRAPEHDAKAWLRLADLESQLGGSMAGVQHALANAIRLAPQQAYQLAPRWIEAGKSALFEIGVDLQLTRENLLRTNTPYPPGTVGSYELYALARGWQDQGLAPFAAETARRLLQSYPHFPLALDLLIRALEDLGETDLLAERLVERVEHGGPGGEVSRMLRDLPEDFLTGAQTVRLMKADPFGTGLVELTRELPDERSKGAAIQGLLRGGATGLGPEGTVLTARILMGIELYAQALNVLDDFPADNPLYARVLRLKTESALALGNEDALAKTLRELADAQVIDRKELLPIVDELLRRGKWRAALIPLERLDSDVWSRGGDVTLRLAVAHMIAGQEDAAQEDLDRAEAYREDGGPELGRVLLTIERNEWNLLPQTVRDVLASDYRPTAFQTAILTALEERLDETKQLVAEGRAAAPEDPLWYLLDAAVANLGTGLVPEAPGFGTDIRPETLRALRGTEKKRRDPREMLAILLTLDVPEWNLWALGELGSAEPGTLWGMYLSADCLRRLGDASTATRFLHLLTRKFPTFAPGWTLLEELEVERLGRADHPEMLDLRATRRAALGDTEGEEAERDLAAAMRRYEQGQLEPAAAGAEKALALRDDMHSARLLIGRVRVRQGRLEAALDAFREYLDREDPELAATAVDEYLDLIDTVAEAGILTPAARTAELSALALRFPRQPLIALALARLDIATLPKHPTAGLERALRRLDSFRKTTADTALEDLAPSAPRAWIDFLLSIDPVRAEELARDELERKPGSVDLWLLVGETLEAQHRDDEAMAHYQKLNDMLPSSRALRRVAFVKARRGNAHPDVMSLIGRIRQLEAKPDGDASLRYTEALSRVSSGPPLIDGGIDMLAELYAAGEGAGPNVSALEIAERYGCALVQRSRYEDSKLAVRVLGEVLDQVEPGLHRDFVQTMQGLGKCIPKPPEPEEAVAQALDGTR